MGETCPAESLALRGLVQPYGYDCLGADGPSPARGWMRRAGWSTTGSGITRR
ncbi:hypothetical protein ACP179_10145 [Xenorhabdus stockiae]|uniref:hypothetical protein n=1 Tax=Xenorhabdus stockiae TaxID=351614 RepID=UPI003CEBA3D9